MWFTSIDASLIKLGLQNVYYKKRCGPLHDFWTQLGEEIIAHKLYDISVYTRDYFSIHMHDTKPMHAKYNLLLAKSKRSTNATKMVPLHSRKELTR